jgi:hypothetical protein
MDQQKQTLPIDYVQQTLKSITVNRMARQCGFMKRKPKKIYPTHLLYGLLVLVLGPGNSFSNLALKIGLINGYTVSKQAVFKRVNENLIAFLQLVLTYVVFRSAKIADQPCFKNQLFSSFNRVLVQDSTSIKLNAKLAQAFPGSRNQTGKKNATLKIQAVIDILTEQFCSFDISSFTKNDQSASKDILRIAQPMDLIIRDLGYFACKVFETLHLRNIFFFESV